MWVGASSAGPWWRYLFDLRDREGIAQVVFDPDTRESFAIAETVRSEFVLQVRGKVRRRPDGTLNEEMLTGSIEFWEKN